MSLVGKTIADRDHAMRLVQAHSAWTPVEGAPAPDFTLPRLGGGSLTLSELRAERPVAVIFGSYT